MFAPVCGPTGKYTCNLCKKSFGTMASFRLHLNVHCKVSCKFRYRKFLNVSSMDKHVQEVHKVSKLPQYHCKLGSCTEWFGTQIESFRHLGNKHRSLLRYRCKKCKDSFFTLEELSDTTRSTTRITHHLRPNGVVADAERSSTT